MVSCEGCGAGISEDDGACPYCGHATKKRVDVRVGTGPREVSRERADIRKGDRTYRVETGADGHTSVQFGDGQSGRRLSSGRDNVSSQYRTGAGSTGNIASGIERNLEKLHSQIRKIPKPKRKGSSDVGVLLLETLATVSNLLSFYQDAIAHEAQLDTAGRKSISKREKRVKPKLKDLVRFCERVEPRTMGQMGISVSDIQKIKTAAIKLLRMTESALCSKCGAMNRPESSRCLKCGRSL